MNMSKTRIPFIIVAVLIAISMVLSACTPQTVVVKETVEVEKEVITTVEVIKETIIEVTPTPVPPTPEPEPIEIGTEENPIIMALAPSATTQELIASGDAIAAQLSELTGYVIKATVPTSYGALVEAMGAGNAHVGWLPPFAYMIAAEKGYATVGLATIRRGSDHYGAQFLANAAAGFTAYFDPAANEGKGANTADAATALAQFEGKKPCWTDPLSSSGYVIPLGIIQESGVKPTTGAFVQGHTTVIKSVYLSPNGEICHFGASFVDARSNVAEELTDVNEKVVVIWRTDPVIPNDNVSFANTMDEAMRTKLIDALMAMSVTEEGLAALKSVYSIDALKVVEDSFYDEFRVYLEASGVDVTSLVK
jgi:phosphonate transport system substrate-binding protein